MGLFLLPGGRPRLLIGDPELVCTLVRRSIAVIAACTRARSSRRAIRCFSMSIYRKRKQQSLTLLSPNSVFSAGIPDAVIIHRMAGCSGGNRNSLARPWGQTRPDWRRMSSRSGRRSGSCGMRCLWVWGVPDYFVFQACQRSIIDPTKPQKTWRTAWRSLVRESAKAAGRKAASSVLSSGKGLRAEIAAWRRATKSIRAFRFHDLRHQAITELAEAGAPDATR